MKYIDAEKLIAEIERHIKHYEKLDRDEFKNGELYICQELLSFITSLQQEQPEVDLKKEIEDWCDENITGVRPIYTADSLIYGLLPKTARHFYELARLKYEK